ncbi:NAD(P)H-binding protein [Streptosporangium sp. NPDC002524]|uniref:SDR family oxidoreductase n=1 Tax=Streptosporangium sp. NPDC002524 TaxID=3154537 RepID=UPI0033311B98
MFLVTGATGSVGRHVLADLLAMGHPVRALSRAPGQASLPRQAEIFQGDLAEPEGLREALRGVRAVYLMALGGAPVPFAELAERSGVRRIVLLSTSDVLDGIEDVERQPDAVARAHAAFEQAVARTGMRWTFLRPNEFAGNSLHWAPQIKAGDVVRAPYPLARTAPIHERDIAAVAVRALTEDGHHGARYELTGPQAITHADQLDAIGAAIGRPLRMEEIPARDAREQMTRYAPPAIVDAVLDQLAAAVERPSVPTDTVRRVLGRSPYPFADWAREHAADFG